MPCVLLALVLSSRGPQSLLSASQLQTLYSQRYLVVPNFLPSGQVDQLRVDALKLGDIGYDCTVGSSSSDTIRVDTRIRKSRLRSLYPPPPNAIGCVDTRAQLIEAVNCLRVELQNSAGLELPQLVPYETELNYLLYPIGGHYVRHLDQPQADRGWQRKGRGATDGGSFCGQHTRRVISFILYLNNGWQPDNGGGLRVFPAHELISCEPPGSKQTQGHVEDVVPEGGTLVLIMSGDVEHQVLETHAERQCVVGWFRESFERRVPDLDAMSLRTCRLLGKEATVVSCRGMAEALSL